MIARIDDKKMNRNAIIGPLPFFPPEAVPLNLPMTVRVL